MDNRLRTNDPHTHTLSQKMTTAKQIATHKHSHTQSHVKKKQHNMNRTILPRKLNLRKWDIRILQFTIRFFFSRDDDGLGGQNLKQILYTHAKITHTHTLPRLVSLFARCFLTFLMKKYKKSLENVRLFSSLRFERNYLRERDDFINNNNNGVKNCWVNCFL